MSGWVQELFPISTISFKSTIGADTFITLIITIFVYVFTTANKIDLEDQPLGVINFEAEAIRTPTTIYLFYLFNLAILLELNSHIVYALWCDSGGLV